MPASQLTSLPHLTSSLTPIPIYFSIPSEHQPSAQHPFTATPHHQFYPQTHPHLNPTPIPRQYKPSHYPNTHPHPYPTFNSTLIHSTPTLLIPPHSTPPHPTQPHPTPPHPTHLTPTTEVWVGVLMKGVLWWSGRWGMGGYEGRIESGVRVDECWGRGEGLCWSGIGDSGG